ncbi:MAG: Nicotinamidase, partial [uncultured Solirubrobacteraceae bacterium]
EPQRADHRRHALVVRLPRRGEPPGVRRPIAARDDVAGAARPRRGHAGDLRQRQLRQLELRPPRAARDRAGGRGARAGPAARPAGGRPVRRQGSPLDLLRDAAGVPAQPGGCRPHRPDRPGHRAVHRVLGARRLHPPPRGLRAARRGRPHPRAPGGRVAGDDGAQHERGDLPGLRGVAAARGGEPL